MLSDAATGGAIYIAGYYEEGAQCSVCRRDESLSNILFQCTIPGRKQILDMFTSGFRKKWRVEPRIDLGSLLGPGLEVGRD